MTPGDFLGKRVKFGSRFGRVLAIVEVYVFAVEMEDPDFDGTKCTYRGHTYVPSGRGTWIRYGTCTIADEDNAFVRSVRSYVDKELNQ